jgi:hypothetical protein
MPEKKVITYSPNNSGGRWWLTDQNYKDLEAEGWTVQWAKDDEWIMRSIRRNAADGWQPAIDMLESGEIRYLGALAKGASKEVYSLNEGIAEWERITGERASDAGCPCCGAPHSFEFDGEYNDVDYEEDSRW